MVSGKMKFLPGMPNTEIEAQYYSKLLMLTGAALVESGFDPASTTPVNPAGIKPNTSAVPGLYTEMLDKARVCGRKRCTVPLRRKSPAERFRPWRLPTSSRA